MRIWQYLVLQKKSIKNDNKNENKIVNKIKNQIQSKIFNNIDNEISINLDKKKILTKINNDQTKLDDLTKLNDKQQNNELVIENPKITKWTNQNDQYFRQNENQNNDSSTEIPLRINHNRHSKQQHKQRKHKFNYNKLSPLPNNRTTNQIEILNNNQIDHEYYQTKIDQQKLLSTKIKNQKTNKFLHFLQTNETTTIQSYLLTNSLIKLHRKVKRRKFNHQLNRHKLKRKRNNDKLNDNYRKIYFNKTRLINNSTLFLLPLTTLSTFKIIANKSIENNQCDKKCLNNIRALELKSDNNFHTTTIDYSTTNQNTTTTNQTNNLDDLEESLRFAKNLMIAIYIIILFSVLLLLLRVIYIAIVRKLRRPGDSSNQQNSARHSSQLYTQNTFNQINYSNYPGANSNSNYNVSNCGGRSSEPNSISGGTASFIGTLTNNLIAHNVQLNRNTNDDKLKKDNFDDKLKHNSLNNQLNRSDSPASLNTIRPFSRQSGKFTDLNIVSDEFSSSVYVNDDEIK